MKFISSAPVSGHSLVTSFYRCARRLQSFVIQNIRNRLLYGVTRKVYQMWHNKSFEKAGNERLPANEEN